MPYKFTEAGNIVKGKGGHPVYIDDNDATNEYEIDAAGAQDKISTITKESNDRRKKLGAATTELTVVSGKVADLQSQVDSIGDDNKVKIEDLKKEINSAWGEKETAWNTEKTTMEGKLFEATVGTQFSNSKVVKTTILPPDIARAKFGKHFNADGSAKDAAGNPIFSKSKPGEPAGFEEALTIIIDSYPGKDSIMKATDASGGDGHRTNNGDLKGGQPKSAIQNIKEGLKAQGIG